jgi:hypothetical protein
MAEQRISGMTQAGVSRTVRTSTEKAARAAAPDIASAGGRRVGIETLTVRVPHDATAGTLAEAVRRAIMEKVR